MPASEKPLACVIGDMDLVRPLGLAGIHSAAVATPGELTRYSRFTAAVIDWADPWKAPEKLLERLLEFGRAQSKPPVLYYEGDWDLLLVSRNRGVLGEVFRFSIADPELIEDLVDKERFRELARRLGLPVPPSAVLADGDDAIDALRLPVIVKPLTRQWETWEPLAGKAKALRIETRPELRRLARQLAEAGVDAVVQELIPGPETAIESYHVYIDEGGEIAAEFTGKKIRTYPLELGQSSALEITDDAGVASLGREIVAQLGLRGVAKFDFKRAADGTLHLLEINPRFNLWHHPGARAGVNIPAIVYADLVGLPRPAAGPVTPGVLWCHPRLDYTAARAAGVSTARWVAWMAGCEAKSGMSWDDPLPVVRRGAWHLSRRLLPRRGAAADQAEHFPTAPTGA
jgi:predicted ATP-grasp superfamily ATP-dependent carboligase